MLRLEFKPQDCWVGVYWRRTPWGGMYLDRGWLQGCVTDVWICLVPMLPIHIRWGRGKPDASAE